MKFNSLASTIKKKKNLQFRSDKPICLPDQKRIYGVARHEDARISCNVEAYPPPDSFRWTFNNTEEMVDVSESKYKNSTRRSQSILVYRPMTEMDYGTVSCWASNTAGQQNNACVFHIIPAGTLRDDVTTTVCSVAEKCNATILQENPSLCTIARCPIKRPNLSRWSVASVSTVANRNTSFSRCSISKREYCKQISRRKGTPLSPFAI